MTGELGAAAAGLLLLERPALGEELDGDLGERLRASQLEPSPASLPGAAWPAAERRR